jgi:copper chaperone NosL
MLGFLKENSTIKKNVKDFYLSDYSGTHNLVKAEESYLYKSEELRSPMGGNIATFANKDSMNAIAEVFPGEAVSWNDLTN